MKIEDDTEERKNCKLEGLPGHHGCGICHKCNKLRAECGHLAFFTQSDVKADVKQHAAKRQKVKPCINCEGRGYVVNSYDRRTCEVCNGRKVKT